MKIPAASMLAVAIAALIGFSLSAPASVGQAPAPATDPVKWEYIAHNYSDAAAMNSVGAQGWELVAVVRHEPPNNSVWAYFKRPKN